VGDLARGSVTDRPWGRTFATPFLRGLTAQLTVVSEGKRFAVAFDHGAVVAAASPLAADAAVRVALTGHLVSSTQVPEIARRQAASPSRDEISVIADLARLGPDHALRLRRRVIAQRAARTFSINHGEFVFTDRRELDVTAGCALDVRAVIYMGARANLSENRLSAELAQLGSWFRLPSGVDDDLPQYGFGELEWAVIERLRDGGTLEELEQVTESVVDARTVRAVVYSLAVCNACETVSAEAVGRLSRRPGARADTEEHEDSDLVAAASTTQPLYGVPMSGGDMPSPSPSPSPSSVSPGGRRPTPTPAPALASSSSARTRTASLHSSTMPMPTVAEGPEARGQTAGRAPTTPPTVRAEPATLASGSAELQPPYDSFEGATPPDGSSAPSHEVAERSPYESARFRRPEPRPERSPSDSGRVRRPEESVRRSEESVRRSEESVRRSEESVRRSEDRGERSPYDSRRERRPEESARRPEERSERSPYDAGRERRPDESARRTEDRGERSPSDSARTRRPSTGGARPTGDSDPALRPPASTPRRTSDSDPALRPPGSGGRGIHDSDPALQPPGSGGRGIHDSDPALRPPGSGRRNIHDSDPALRPPGSTPRRTSDSDRSSTKRQSESNPALRPPPVDASPQVVIRRAATPRPTPSRKISRTESPHSHEVKALIAQRLKLLDQGADHFALLGVSHDVATDLLRKSYFALARQLHPDRLAALGISDEGKHAQRLFAQINTGFAILSDPGRRAEYLSVLRRGGEAAVRAEQARAEEMARRILEAEEAFRRGELALRRDQPQAAVVELELAIRLHPEEADYQALLTWAQFCAAPDRAAVAAKTRAQLEKVLQRVPKAANARFFLGRVERMLGRDQEALRHFRDVLTAAPGHTDAAAEIRALESRLGGGDKPGVGFFGRNKR
jgi:DnaJ-domain-containing protein 1